MRGDALDRDGRCVGGSGVVVLIVGVVPGCVGDELKRSAGYSACYHPVVIFVVIGGAERPLDCFVVEDVFHAVLLPFLFARYAGVGFRGDRCPPCLGVRWAPHSSFLILFILHSLLPVSQAPLLSYF
jgi:hypothetical protein